MLARERGPARGSARMAGSGLRVGSDELLERRFRPARRQVIRETRHLVRGAGDCFGAASALPRKLVRARARARLRVHTSLRLERALHVRARVRARWYTREPGVFCRPGVVRAEHVGRGTEGFARCAHGHACARACLINLEQGRPFVLIGRG